MEHPAAGRRGSAIRSEPRERKKDTSRPTNGTLYAATDSGINWHTQIIAEWMVREGYASAHAFGFQRYDERFKGLDQIEDSILEAWVAVPC